MPVKAYTRFGPLVAQEVGEEQLDFDEVEHSCEQDDDQTRRKSCSNMSMGVEILTRTFKVNQIAGER